MEIISVVNIKLAYKMASQIIRAKIRAERSIFDGSSIKESNLAFDKYRELACDYKNINFKIRDEAQQAAIRCVCL